MIDDRASSTAPPSDQRSRALKAAAVQAPRQRSAHSITTRQLRTPPRHATHCALCGRPGWWHRRWMLALSVPGSKSLRAFLRRLLPASLALVPRQVVVLHETRRFELFGDARARTTRLAT